MTGLLGVTGEEKSHSLLVRFNLDFIWATSNEEDEVHGHAAKVNMYEKQPKETVATISLG